VPNTKKTDFNQSRSKTPAPILMKLSMVDYVWDPPHMTTLVGVAHCRWSGQICDLSNPKCFCSLFYFFAFFTRSHFLTDCGDLYAKTHVFGQQCAFWRSWQYLTTFRGSNPTKTSPKWAGIGIFKQKWQKEKSTHLKNWFNWLAQNYLHFFRPHMRLCGWSSNNELQIQDKGRCYTILDFR